MDKKESEQLKVFGFGLALFIPLFVLLKHLHHHLGILSFIILIAGVLFVLSKLEGLFIAYWLILVGVWGFIFFGDHRELTAFPMIFLVIAGCILVASLTNINLLKPVYHYWMKAAHLIGGIITTVVLLIFYYLVFGLAGIVLKLMRKDLLDRHFDASAQSYWIKRKEEFNRESYKRQF